MKKIIYVLPLLLILTGCGKEMVPDKDPLPSGTTLTENSCEAPSARIFEDIGTCDPVYTADLQVTEEMYKKAFVNEGCRYRLARVLEKAASGTPVTLAYIGGSITDGDSASPKDSACYAYLTTQWWRDCFPDTTITYINAGIGATDSYIGVHRAADDVLSKAPDLVVVEYSVNDTNNINRETYESLLRNLLESENDPAVISLELGTKWGGFADKHALLAFHYGIPIVSYQALLANSMISWEDVGSSDGVHPANPGHALIANLLTEYYSETLEDLRLMEKGEAPVHAAADCYDEEALPTDSITACSYRNPDLLYSSDVTADNAEGFAPAQDGPWILNGKGWSTSSGGNICFTIDASCIGIAYLQWKTAPVNGAASMDVYIDDEYITTVNSFNPESWGNHLEYAECLKTDTPGRHRLELRLTGDSADQCFELLGICVTK